MRPAVFLTLFCPPAAGAGGQKKFIEMRFINRNLMKKHTICKILFFCMDKKVLCDSAFSTIT